MQKGARNMHGIPETSDRDRQVNATERHYITRRTLAGHLAPQVHSHRPRDVADWHVLGKLLDFGFLELDEL